ncbi:hypothetical protein MMC24_005008 [Lignoscripta atroalba]|nr:hypothetical protein [Lignoscripta atroalba]
MDAPPSYEAAAASSVNVASQHKTRNGIPPLTRRSMEDEARPLPPGWSRQFDPQTSHQFFVDTKAQPPRSIWHHPYDDQQYLDSLASHERERVQGLHKVPSHADIEAESSDDGEGGYHHDRHKNPAVGAGGSASHASDGKTTFGRRMKDKITGSTHEQREAYRLQRGEEERRAYERHQALRQAMARAIETGQPQLVGRDRDGKDVYIEPPYGGNMPHGAYGYNPYTQGPYANPNATFIRPNYPYARPYGYGYGGGYGMPLAGGLMGGVLLGGLMF